MGHHMVEDMKAVRAALDALTLQSDGVNGKQLYLYGEGWDFGEVQGNKRGLNATQINCSGRASALSMTAFGTRCAAAIRLAACRSRASPPDW